LNKLLTKLDEIGTLDCTSDSGKSARPGLLRSPNTASVYELVLSQENGRALTKQFVRL